MAHLPSLGITRVEAAGSRELFRLNPFSAIVAGVSTLNRNSLSLGLRQVRDEEQGDPGVLERRYGRAKLGNSETVRRLATQT